MNNETRFVILLASTTSVVSQFLSPAPSVFSFTVRLLIVLLVIYFGMLILRAVENSLLQSAFFKVI
jgi:hypothetical protein